MSGSRPYLGKKGRVCWGEDCISLGKIGPLLVPVIPVAPGVGVGETPRRGLWRRVKAGRNLSRLLADEQELVLPTEVNYNLYKAWPGAKE